MSLIQNTLKQCLKNLTGELKHIQYGENICLLQLPQFLHEHFKLSGFNDSEALIMTTDSCWLSQLRQYEIALLKALNQAGYHHIKSIQWRINPKLKYLRPTPPTKPRQQHQLSSDTASVIAESAQYCRGEKTKKQLLKLAATIKKKSRQ